LGALLVLFRDAVRVEVPIDDHGILPSRKSTNLVSVKLPPPWCLSCSSRQRLSSAVAAEASEPPFRASQKMRLMIGQRLFHLEAGILLRNTFSEFHELPYSSMTGLQSHH